jgi:monoamine oxidase
MVCDVAVLGAGVAGLTAARALVGQGLSVRVHEARDRVGGRLLSVTHAGGSVDLGASWFWPDEPLVQQLVDELAVRTFPQELAGDAMFEADHRGARRLEGNPIDVVSGRFTRGAQALARVLAERLPEGVLRLSDPVTAVNVDDGVVTVEAASGVTTARHVVVAIPPALAVEAITFRPELPADLRRLAESTAVWMGGVVKAVAVFDRPYWRDLGLAGAAVSHLGPFNEIHDHSGPDGTPAALFGFAAAASFDRATPEQIGTAFTDQLRRLFGATAATPLHIHVTDWSLERYTTPRAPSLRASTTGYGHPLYQQPTAGRIHWASTETSARNSGHIEGALRAGTHAAQTVTVALAADGFPHVRR